MSNEQHGQSGDEHGQNTVQIEMDGNPFSIHRGHQTVAAIKAASGVDPNFVLEQIGDDGKLVLLDNGGAVTIKGGERFVAHVAGGGSS